MVMRLIIEPIVRAALLEDLGRAGDITTDAIVPEHAEIEAVIAARQPGVVAGLEAALLAFELLDPGLRDRAFARRRRPGLARRYRRPHRRPSPAGFGRRAHRAEHSVPDVRGRHRDPGLGRRDRRRQGQDRVHAQDHPRAAHLGKGGGPARRRRQSPLRPRRRDADQGQPHCDGGRGAAGARTRARHAGHLVKIELEVDTLDQLAEALAVGVDAVLLDNMAPETLRRAVAMVDGRAVTEASGRISLETVAAVAATGVDLISSGWITHSAPILDLGLDIAD